MKHTNIEDSIYRYIENDMDDDKRADFEKHLEECEECRSLYNDILKDEEIFKSLASDLDKDFKSSKKEILEKIDVNKYKKSQRNYKRIIAIAASFFITIGIVAFAYIKINTESENITTSPVDKENNDEIDNETGEPEENVEKKEEEKELENKEETKESNTKKESTKNNVQVNEQVNKIVLSGVEDKKEIRLEITELDKSYDPDFRTPWIESGRYKACLAGKGEYNGEEGYATLYLTDMKMDGLACKKIEYSSWNNEQKTILKIKFVSNSSGFQELALMVGSAHGTIAKGGDLYIYNPSTNNAYRAYKCGDREQVVNVKQNGNGNMIIEVIKYDENYMSYDTLTKEIKVIYK